MKVELASYGDVKITLTDFEWKELTRISGPSIIRDLTELHRRATVNADSGPKTI